jgi:hexosaminidase
VAFAADRGVTIVPEIEMPGHGGKMVAGRPDLFRTGPYHGSTLNIANPDAVAALKSMIAEVASVFSTSPYIHIGADEADFSQLGYGYVGYMSDGVTPSVTPQARAQWDGKMDQLTTQLRASGDIGPTATVTSAQDVFRDFLNQMNDYVANDLGKQMIAWEGFGSSGKVPVNKDIIVMSFEQAYYNPLRLVKDGYRNINASWSPMYVVAAQDLKPDYPTGAGIAAATLEQIYNWNKQFFDVYYGNVSPTSGTYVPDDYAAMILGGQLTAWENTEGSLLAAIRQRLGATAEKLWTPDCPWTYDDFLSRLMSTDALLEQLLLANGMALPAVSLMGDTNGDGVANLIDLNNVRNNFGGSGAGDTNGDGVADLADLNNVRNNFGQSLGGAGNVPEPATLALLGLGGLALLKGKRRDA